MDDAEVVELTVEELEAAIESTLRRAGYTYDELAALAAADDLSLRARLVWMAVRRDQQTCPPLRETHDA